jgi:ABC-type amino acid transport substrate-binding protein
MALEREHRDLYIALGVGGVALILIFLYLYGGTQQPVATNSNGASLPGLTETPAADATPYTYNVQPYYPNPGIQYVPNNSNTNQASGGCGGCGKKNECFNASSNNCTTSQFMTLIGYGSNAGA